MKSEDLLRQLSDIDDKYIDEAAPKAVVSGMKPRSLKKYYIFAGVAAAAVIALFSLKVFSLMDPVKSSTTAPAMSEAASDMAPHSSDEEASKEREPAMSEAAESTAQAQEEAWDEESVAEAEAEDDVAETEEAVSGAEDLSKAPAAITGEDEKKMKAWIDNLNGGQTEDSFREAVPEEIGKTFGREFLIPDEAVDVSLRMSGEDTAEAYFKLEGNECILKMHKADGFEDISQTGYDWDQAGETKIDGKEAKKYKSDDFSCVMWYNDGVMYSVAVTGDMDAEDLAALSF